MTNVKAQMPNQYQMPKLELILYGFDLAFVLCYLDFPIDKIEKYNVKLTCFLKKISSETKYHLFFERLPVCRQAGNFFNKKVLKKIAPFRHTNSTKLLVYRDEAFLFPAVPPGFPGFNSTEALF